MHPHADSRPAMRRGARVVPGGKQEKSTATAGPRPFRLRRAPSECV